MDRLCEDYCGGIWNLYTLNNGGAFMAPEPDDDDDETWVLFNAMNGNRAEMSPEAAGIAACLMTYSHHACRTENYAMTVHYYRLRDYALQHPECSAISEVQDIPGVLAVFAERRKDSFGPYVRLMSVTLN
ncbi:TPA: DUF987 family protein [Escherichia coli]|nr:DUF987 family protein [Escherichia coli]HAL9553176.1 DUF987 family protein [Escherichia coli]